MQTNKVFGRKLLYWASFTSRDRKFSDLHYVLLDSNSVVSWTARKESDEEADHSPLPIAEVLNMLNYLLVSHKPWLYNA
jgi:hypothetical protein